MLKNLMFVAMGGAVGAMLRYGISSGIYSWFGRSFPYGTLVVNMTGCFLMGICYHLVEIQVGIVPSTLGKLRELIKKPARVRIG